MSEQHLPPQDTQAIRRRVQAEAGAWGVLGALHTAFVGTLLLSRGAGPLALGVYNSGINLFGLGAAWLGPLLAVRLGGVAPATLLPLVVARLIFVAVPLLIAFTSDSALPILIAVLVASASGEGVALPLWTAFLASLAAPAERGRWLAWRATVAARAAACVLVPMLILLCLGSTEGVLFAAFALAAVAGVAGVVQMRALFRAMSPPPVPATESVLLACGGRERRFMAGVFCFWFGSALNRPVLPSYIVDGLHAPPAFFAATAAVAALTAVLVQPWWGRFGDARGAQAVLGLSGLGAGTAPLLWSIVPVFWLGLPVEIVASGCWLGHLYGLTLGAMALAPDDAQLPGVVARTYLAQGTAAALAPLVAVAVVEPVGTSPLLVTSGLICLGATGLIIGGPEEAWGVTLLTRQRQLLVALERTGGVRRLLFGEYSFAWAGYHQAKLYDPRPTYPLGQASGAGAAGEGQARTRLPLVLKRAMAADCVSCAGIGCRSCYGTGLR